MPDMKNGTKRAKFSITMKSFAHRRLDVKENDQGTQKHPVQNANFLVRFFKVFPRFSFSKVLQLEQSSDFMRNLGMFRSPFLAVPPPLTLVFNRRHSAAKL